MLKSSIDGQTAGRRAKTDMKKQTVTDTQTMNNLSTGRLEKRLYDVSEASRYLGMSVWGLREMYYHGKITAVRIGRRMLFDILDLDQWIEDHKKQLTY